MSKALKVHRVTPYGLVLLGSIDGETPRDILLVADAVGLPRKTVAKMARELPRQARRALHELQARCGDTGVAYWGDRLDGDMTARMDVLEAVDA